MLPRADHNQAEPAFLRRAGVALRLSGGQALTGTGRKRPRALIVYSALMLLLSAANVAAEERIRPVKPVSAPAGFSTVCDRYSWACASKGGSAAASASEMAVARKVNVQVNRSVRQISDRRQYGSEEMWSLPTGQGGDCEDLVLLKKRELVRAGLAPEGLLIATVLDRRREPHAVLVVRAESGDYVLDNLTDRVVRWNDTGYSFIRMQNPDAPTRWSAVFAGGVFAKS